MEKSTTMWLIFTIIILAIIGVSFFFYAKNFNYKPFTLDENQCEHYYKSCICLGGLMILKTYPIQYECQGLPICKSIDETKCQ